jgi:hypothetical protein
MSFDERDFAMPRQPYYRVSPNTPAINLVFGTYVAGKRLGLELLVGQCVMAWPPVETEMALILGHLIGAKDAAALAVFHHLRRSASQREAVMEAAGIVLNVYELELITALLNVHKSIEAERNALAHGYFGAVDDLPNDLLWLGTNDYVALKALITLRGAISSFHPEWTDTMKKFYVYREADLRAIHDDIRWLGAQWFDLLAFLRTKPPRTDGPLYYQLCDQPRIAQELLILRQKNSPSTQAQSPPPTDGGTA